MFLGHFGAGFAGKLVDNKPSLGTLFLASQFIDLLWPFFLILGIERVTVNPGNTVVTPLEFSFYPFSHSLMGVLFWAILFGGIYFLATKRIKTSLLLAFLVLSHWFFDLIVHRPDLPLTISNQVLVGFGLWNSFMLTIILEFLIFGAGAYFYIRSTRNQHKKGIWLTWSLIIFLCITYVINLISPPPPDPEAIGYVGLSQWLIIGWGYWIDKNRIWIHKIPLES